MSYEVLARRWRPRNFSEVVGQGHVLRALINALDNDRLHHAFLFTGTRGVGKTTLARILAKSINCDTGISSTPCGECATCKEIDEGRFADLIEVDAASRTKVEDTRELLENVQYAPTRGRFKVYLIDEVHMLSNHSFNALLKTLEEPPPHVKFLLATTDPQKLPVTILSRCLQFNLKRITNEEIESQLNKILETDSVNADADAIEEIAEAADGSMRDALSLLDQAISYGAGELKSAEVRDMLGTIDRQRILKLIEKLTEADSRGLMTEVDSLASMTPDFTSLLHELNSRFQQIALLQQIPDAAGPRVSERDQLLQFAQQLSPEDVQLYYQIGLAGVRDMPYVPDSRTGFEMVLLRMLAFKPAGSGVKKKLVEPLNADKIASVRASLETKPEVDRNNAPSTPTVEAKKEPARAPDRSEIRDTIPVDTEIITGDEDDGMPPTEWGGYEDEFLPVRQSRTISESKQSASQSPLENDDELSALVSDDVITIDGKPEDWHEWVSHLKISMMTRQLADHCVISSIDGHHIKLLLDPNYTHLNKPNWLSNLENALSEYLKGSIRLEIQHAAEDQKTHTPARKRQKQQQERQQSAIESIHNDPFVQEMIETFDAVVIDETITPR